MIAKGAYVAQQKLLDIEVGAYVAQQKVLTIAKGAYVAQHKLFFNTVVALRGNSIIP